MRHTIRYVTDDGRQFVDLHFTEKEYAWFKHLASLDGMINIGSWIINQALGKESIAVKEISAHKSRVKMDAGDFVEVNDFSHPEFAHAELVVEIDGDTYWAEGYSRRHPIDVPNAHIGILLAYGRALEILSRRILRQANGLVKHYDDLAERREAEVQEDEISYFGELPAAPEPVSKKKGAKNKK